MLPALQGIAQFCLLAVVGMLLGIAFGMVTSWLLDNIFRDATLTTIVTLVSAYSSYYVADRLVGASGLLAVVCNGFTMSLIGGFVRGQHVSRCYVWTRWLLILPRRAAGGSACTSAVTAPSYLHLLHLKLLEQSRHRSWLCVVCCLLFVAGGRQITMRVEDAMHSFWGVLEWAANTILFVWMGIVLAIVLPPSHAETVITDQPIHLEGRDAAYVVLLYVWLQV